MEESYIQEETWVKCTIDGITYDCYFEYERSRLLSKPWVEVTVRKCVTKKLQFFRWKVEWQVEEFECHGFPDLNGGEWIWVNKTLYFKSEYIKDWVKVALNRRESEIHEKQLEIEKEKNLNILKQI